MKPLEQLKPWAALALTVSILGTLASASAAIPPTGAEPAPGSATREQPTTAEPSPEPRPGDSATKARELDRDEPVGSERPQAVALPHGLRSIPPLGLEAHEQGVIKRRTLRNWDLLTYPSGTLPSMPYEAARRHVEAKVRDAKPWRNGALDLPRFRWQKATVDPSETVWTAVGPRPVDSDGTVEPWAYSYGPVAGRVGADALAVDPTNLDIAYVGFAAGGFWKTTNLSATSPTWTPLWDDKEFVTQAVSAITIDPTDSSVLYAGTGDWVAQDQIAAGIMKSTDQGATWSHLGADVFTPYSPSLPAGGNGWWDQSIKTIAVDPNQPDTLLVGTFADLYLSNDGGATWQICGFGNDYTSPSASVTTVDSINRISSIYLDSRGSRTTAYVAVGSPYQDWPTNNSNQNNGVYRFVVPTSGCPSWPGDFTTLFSGFPAGTGTGISTTGRIELAGSTASGSLTLYAQVSDALSYDNEGTYVLRPDSGSTSWQRLANWNSYGSCTSNSTIQDLYDLSLAVDPTDDKRLYIGHIDLFEATVDSTYTSMSQEALGHVYSRGCSAYGTLHPDQHAFEWVGTTGEYLLGNDGGVYRSDASNVFEPLNDAFNTTQFYAGQLGADFASGGNGNGQWIFGGMQDNGNATWDSSSSTFEWTARSIGGDGFFTAFDVLSGSETTGRWVSEYTEGRIAASSTGADGPFTYCGGAAYLGQAGFSTPLMVDTLNCSSTECSNYILGEDTMWAATSFSASCPQWQRISDLMVTNTVRHSIHSVAIAPTEPKAILAGTTDGSVYLTFDAFLGQACTRALANTEWFDCTPNTSASWIEVDASHTTLPNRAILQTAFDPTDAKIAYVAVGGFDQGTPSTPGHLFQLVHQAGAVQVVDKTGNLPNVPASSVIVNPNDRRQVFVGTHFGFYYTSDIDAVSPTWVRFNEGLPNTVIEYLTIDRGAETNPYRGTTLAAFTFGRGAYLLKLPPTTLDQLPTLAITSPADGTTVDYGTAIGFQATVADAEDGTPTQVEWTSSIDGSFGNGADVSVSTLSPGNHFVTAIVTDSAGQQRGAAVTVTVGSGMPFQSIGAEDGFARESSETSNVGNKANWRLAGHHAIRVGDDAKRRQFKAVLSFDTSSLPTGAVITSAKVRMRRGTIYRSNTFDGSWGACWADIMTGGFSGSTALQVTDFEAAATASQVAFMSTPLADLDWTEGVLDATGLAAISRTGRTQFRIECALDDDNDNAGDNLGFYSGSAPDAASWPQLLIAFE